MNSEIKKKRHRVYNFTTDSLDPKFLLEKLEFVLDSLNCAAKMNVLFGFVFKT